jgi:hypothetical protein
MNCITASCNVASCSATLSSAIVAQSSRALYNVVASDVTSPISTRQSSVHGSSPSIDIFFKK